MAVTEDGYTPADSERASLESYWDFMERHREAISARTQELATEIPAFARIVESMSAEQMAEREAHSQRLQQRAMVDGEWGPYLTDLAEQGATYARMGVPYRAWFELVRGYRVVATELIREELGADVARPVIELMAGMDTLIDVAMANIGMAYLATKQDIIATQAEAIREISTPVLQIHDGMLILPIVGVIDTARARQTTRTLLHAIRDRRAEVVVMDITGVPMVDSKVANHLVQTVEAARLMGAVVILSGVAPEIAETLVAIGASLGEIRTVGDLQRGVRVGEALLDERGAT